MPRRTSDPILNHLLALKTAFRIPKGMNLPEAVAGVYIEGVDQACPNRGND